MPTKINKTFVGKQIENLAAIYLQQKKLQLLTRNFRSPYGEIDLILLDPRENQLVFTEVRYRKSTLFGEAAATINKIKQDKLIKTANYYLINQYISDHNQQVSCRFDVVACSGPLDRIKIEWFPGAFC